MDTPPAGSGNGGRTCFGCGCAIIIFTIIVMLLMYIPPLVISEYVSFQDTFGFIDGWEWVSPSCLSSMCCFGFMMIGLSIWLILIDDPSKAKRRPKR